jgi:hypothetical protein
LIGMQTSQIRPFRPIVAAIEPIAKGGRAASVWSPDGSRVVNDSCRIWMNEITMMMEKIKMPKGSSLLLPTGNLALKLDKRHCTSLLVDHMMSVQRRSRAESTMEAIREREEEKHTAAILAARRRMFATTLI